MIEWVARVVSYPEHHATLRHGDNEVDDGDHFCGSELSNNVALNTGGAVDLVIDSGSVALVSAHAERPAGRVARQWGAGNAVGPPRRRRGRLVH
jgi:hypothetical protein